MSKIFKQIIIISLVLLVAAALVIDTLFIYYKYINKDVVFGTNYVSTINTSDLIKAEDLTETQRDEYEQRYFMVANYFDNSNNNGLPLQEIQFNYSSDYRLEEPYATGMQYVGEYKHIDLDGDADKAGQHISDLFNFYDTFDRISWKATTALTREKELIISIDGEPFSIKLDGSTKEKKRSWIFERDYIYFYLYDNLFEAVMEAIQSNSAGYGDWYFKMNLSKYFSIKAYDDSGKFLEDDVTDIIDTYVMVKIHYSPNGVVNSSQSLFGIINNDSNFLLGENYTTDYWQERVVYTLNNEDFMYRNSEAYSGNFVYLTIREKQHLNSLSKVKINVVIDATKDNIIGLDINAFEGIKIDTLTILGEGNFYLLQKSLAGTDLKVLKRSNELVLVKSSSAITTTYEEVIL